MTMYALNGIACVTNPQRITTQLCSSLFLYRVFQHLQWLKRQIFPSGVGGNQNRDKRRANIGPGDQKVSNR